MPGRKELLVWGFRHGRAVLRNAKKQKVAAVANAASAQLPAKEALPRSRHADATQLRFAAAQRGNRSMPPSFAASPVWGSTSSAFPAVQQAGSDPLPAAAAVLSRLPAAVKRNPLYRLATLDPAPPAGTIAQPPADGGLQPLARYAKLGAMPAPEAAAKLSATSALLKFAKMAK